MDKYKISSTGNSINYLPQYIAEKLGFFKEQDLDVETHIPANWTQCLSDIDSGEYHAVCGGIWVPNMYQLHNVNKYLSFAKISSKCPFKLVARENKPFNWKDVEGKTILVPCDGGASGYIFLVGTLKKYGVDVSKVRFIHDFVNHMLVETFSKGTFGDYICTQAVWADELQDQGHGYIVSEMAKDGDTIPWSVYYTNLAVAQDPKALNKRFALGLQKGIDWLLAHYQTDPDGVISHILAERWGELNVQTGKATVARFVEEGMWSPSIEITKSEFETYLEYQLDAGIIDRLVSAEEMVDYDVLDFVNQHK
ncbi:ABC transporter substrate-binding protein [Pasteurellaceae bacterium 22721_9_1]